MSAAGTLLLCSEPLSPKWQVCRPRHGRLVLIGWADATPAVDAGVPSWAIHVLAGALTKAHQATFPSTVVRPEDAESYTVLSTGGIWRRLTSNGPHTFSLITTQCPTTLANAFNDAGFPWWMQSQFVLMSAMGAPRPLMSSDDVLGLISAPETAERLLETCGLVGVLIPGVDGDVAALLTLAEAEELGFITAMHEVARGIEVTVETLVESAFLERLANHP